MMQTDDDSTAIFASDGSAIQRLHLCNQVNGLPVLADETGAPVAPWQAELLRWPPEIEATLKRSGYLLLRTPDAELWCNCAD